MTGKLNKCIVILFLIVTVACKTGSKQQYDKEDYVAGLKNEKTNVLSKTIGDVTYNLIYKPADYVMLMENKNLNKELFDSIKNDYRKMEYYTLELVINNFNDEILKYKTRSPEEYSEKVDYYSFRFQQDVFEVIEKDTLKCTSYHFERNYGISPKIRFNLAFASSVSEADRTIYINDKYLGTGPVKMTFSKKDLNNLPELKF